MLDGYDEVGGTCTQNLYKINQLFNYPNTKVLISCRTRYFRPGYKAWFEPWDEQKPRSDEYEEYRLCPFTDDQIMAYLNKYEDQYPERGTS